MGNFLKGKLHTNASESFALGKNENKTCCPLLRDISDACSTALSHPMAPVGGPTPQPYPDHCTDMGWGQLQILLLVFSTTLLDFLPSQCSSSWMHPRGVQASQWLHPAKRPQLAANRAQSCLKVLVKAVLAQTTAASRKVWRSQKFWSPRNFSFNPDVGS